MSTVASANDVRGERTTNRAAIPAARMITAPGRPAADPSTMTRA
jgi:hypothetical protein